MQWLLILLDLKRVSKKVRELRICLLPQALLIHFIIFELFQIKDFSPVDDIRQLDMFIL